MTVSARIAQFLVARSREAFCDRCLASQLHFSLEQLLSGLEELNRTVSVWPGISTCALCHRPAHVIAVGPSPPVVTT